MITRASHTTACKAALTLLMLVIFIGVVPAVPSGGRLAEGTDAAVWRAGRLLPRKSHQSTTLYAKDRIATKDQRAVIRWADGSRAILETNSELVLRPADDNDDLLYLLLTKGEVAYTFALESQLRVGFHNDSTLYGSVANGTPLTGHLAVTTDGRRVFNPVDLAKLSGRGDDNGDGDDDDGMSGDDVGEQIDANLQYDQISRHAVTFAVGTQADALEIHTVTADGNDSVTKISEGVPHSEHPRWSPDLNRLLYSRRVGTSHDIVIHDITRVGMGDEIEVITDTADINETEPVWGDGYIYFVSDEDGDSAIYRMDFDGEDRQRVTVPSLRAESPDQRLLSPAAGHSTQIVFSGWSGTNRDIYRIDPDGNLDSLQVVADMPGSDETSPRWSTNGKRVAFITDTFGPKNIQERDIETGEMTIEALLPNTAADIFYTNSVDFAYSPSGENFVVSYGGSPGATGADTLAIVDRNGSIVRVLEHGMGDVVILSPDWVGGYVPVAWWPAATTAGVVVGGIAGAGVLGVVVYDLVDDDDDDDDDRPPRSPFRP